MSETAAKVHRTIDDIDPSDWNACFPGEPEGWAYLRAVERAGLPGFEWTYFVVMEGSKILAAVPAFTTEYNLTTTVQGRLKDLLTPLLRRTRSLLTLKMLCLGSPLTDRCPLGFSSLVPPEDRANIATLLFTAADEWAAARGIGLVAAKDISTADLADDIDGAFSKAGYSRQPGLPNARLALPYSNEAAYLDSLSSSARREVRRKLKTAGRVNVEEHRGTSALDLVPDLLRLYDQQRTGSSVDFEQFETLTPAYFRNVIEGQPNALVFVFRHEGRIAGFNLCYYSERVFVDKFIGFEPGIARELNLYVLSWMTNVRFCIDHGIQSLQTGQTGYAMKRRLGSTLEPAWIYFRHRNAAANLVLRMASPLLAADRYDDDLHGRGARS